MRRISALVEIPAGARVAGADEAGAGALAGPVVAAAVVLGAHDGLDGVKDSKLLKPRARQLLEEIIKERAIAWAVSFVPHTVVDEINILEARLGAMSRAIRALWGDCDIALVDGNRVPHNSPVPVRAVVGGDASVREIAAASILAKVARDAWMKRAAKDFPGYGFERNVGYGTGEHLAALKLRGASPIHRRSYAPVRESL